MQIQRHTHPHVFNGESGACLLRVPTPDDIQTLSFLFVCEEASHTLLTLSLSEASQLQAMIIQYQGSGRWKRNTSIAPTVLTADTGEKLVVQYTNFGEPFRQGFSFEIEAPGATVYGFFPEEVLAALSALLASWLTRLPTS